MNQNLRLSRQIAVLALMLGVAGAMLFGEELPSEVVSQLESMLERPLVSASDLAKDDRQLLSRHSMPVLEWLESEVFKLGLSFESATSDGTRRTSIRRQRCLVLLGALDSVEAKIARKDLVSECLAIIAQTESPEANDILIAAANNPGFLSGSVMRALARAKPDFLISKLDVTQPSFKIIRELGLAKAKSAVPILNKIAERIKEKALKRYVLEWRMYIENEKPIERQKKGSPAEMIHAYAEIAKKSGNEISDDESEFFMAPGVIEGQWEDLKKQMTLGGRIKSLHSDLINAAQGIENGNTKFKHLPFTEQETITVVVADGKSVVDIKKDIFGQWRFVIR